MSEDTSFPAEGQNMPGRDRTHLFANPSQAPDTQLPGYEQHKHSDGFLITYDPLTGTLS